LKIKLKGRHLDTNEVIEAESQAVLNTLTLTDGGKVVIPTRRLHFTPQKYYSSASGTHLLEAE
jgi:hypothetical protein